MAEIHYAPDFLCGEASANLVPPCTGAVRLPCFPFSAKSEAYQFLHYCMTFSARVRPLNVASLRDKWIVPYRTDPSDSLVAGIIELECRFVKKK